MLQQNLWILTLSEVNKHHKKPRINSGQVIKNLLFLNLFLILWRCNCEPESYLSRLCNINYLGDSVPSTLHYRIKPHSSSGRGNCYYPHFADEEMEAYKLRQLVWVHRSWVEEIRTGIQFPFWWVARMAPPWDCRGTCPGGCTRSLGSHRVCNMPHSSYLQRYVCECVLNVVEVLCVCVYMHMHVVGRLFGAGGPWGWLCAMCVSASYLWISSSGTGSYPGQISAFAQFEAQKKGSKFKFLSSGEVEPSRGT